MNAWRPSLQALHTQAQATKNLSKNITAGIQRARQAHAATNLSSRRNAAPPPPQQQRRAKSNNSTRPPPSFATMAPWSAALTRYAQTPDPSKLAPTEVLHWDDQTITIHDGFEKAKYHFLVLPRIPFRRRKPKADAASGSGSGIQQSSTTPAAEADKDGDDIKPPQLQSVGGKLTFGASSNQSEAAAATVPKNHIFNLSDLLRSPYAAEVLDAMSVTAERVSSK